MTDDEWKLQRERSILAAFQTGRPVFADTDGELRYIDGAQEPVADDVGVGVVKPGSRAKKLAVRAERASRLSAERASRLSYVVSIIVAIMNGVMALLWNSWPIVPAIVLAACAVVWHRVNYQRAAALAAREDQGVK